MKTTAQSTTPPDQFVPPSNPDVDFKIDTYIRENPKYWAYVQAMPRDRLERTVVLNEVREVERQQRIRKTVMEPINANPELKQAYELVVKNVPKEKRSDVIAMIAWQLRLLANKPQ